jgi:hypothetical protein
MFKIFVLFILLNSLAAQYVLNKGFYLGANISKTASFLFESDTKNTDFKGDTFRGDGESFGLTALYKFDKRNFIGIDFNRNQIEMEHNSSVLRDSTVSSITEKDEFTLIRLFYVKKFTNNPLFISGGLEAHLPIENSEENYIHKSLKRAQGYTAIGLLFDLNKVDLNILLSYSFPLSKYKARDELEINYGEFNLGLRVYFKLF